MLTNANLGMECFLKDIEFHGVLLDSLWHTGIIRRVVDDITEMIAEGLVTPLETTVFPHTKISEIILFVKLLQRTSRPCSAHIRLFVRYSH